jgi:hypothetical protein
VSLLLLFVGATTGVEPEPEVVITGGGTSKRRKRPKTYAEIAHAEVAFLALDVPQIEPIEEQDEDEILLLALTRILH